MFSLTVVISIAAVRVVLDRCGRAQTRFYEVSRATMHNRLQQNATLVFRKVDERVLVPCQCVEGVLHRLRVRG